MNTLYYIPNAILLKDQNEEYFFGSFIDRDHCFDLLSNLTKVARTLSDLSLQNPDNEHHQKLSFGLQKDTVSDLVSNLTDLAAFTMAGPAQSTPAVSSKVDDDDDEVKQSSDEVMMRLEGEELQISSSPPRTMTSLSAPTVDSSVLPEPLSPSTKRSLPSQEFKSLFHKCSVEVLLTETINAPVSELWRTCWQDSSDYW